MPFNAGYHYALTLKSTALGLVYVASDAQPASSPPISYEVIYMMISSHLIPSYRYGPIYPPAYLLTSIGLLLSYLCTRNGLRHWCSPPQLTQRTHLHAMPRSQRSADSYATTRLTQCTASHAMPCSQRSTPSRRSLHCVCCSLIWQVQDASQRQG
jgi:hypothetical protein